MAQTRGVQGWFVLWTQRGNWAFGQCCEPPQATHSPPRPGCTDTRPATSPQEACQEGGARTPGTTQGLAQASRRPPIQSGRGNARLCPPHAQPSPICSTYLSRVPFPDPAFLTHDFPKHPSCLECSFLSSNQYPASYAAQLSSHLLHADLPGQARVAVGCPLSMHPVSTMMWASGRLK